MERTKHLVISKPLSFKENLLRLTQRIQLQLHETPNISPIPELLGFLAKKLSWHSAGL